jgi:hypothetical protein
MFARFSTPASFSSLGTFSRAFCGQADMQGADSHRRQIRAKRIISSSESIPLFDG